MKKGGFIEVQGRQRVPTYINLKITTQSRQEVVNHELIEHVYILGCIEDQSIVLARVLSLLHREYNIPVENRQVSFYYAQADLFVNCGLDPISPEVRIQSKEFETGVGLHLLLRDLGLLRVQRLMVTPGVVGKAGDEGEEQQKKGCRRTKQRRIGYIIEKVIEWRKYYSGTVQQSRQHQKLSLDDAAERVGISKKSLDDYLFQIRFGHRFGFNFNQHYNQKVGILRDFVRQQKKATTKTENKTRKRKLKAESSEE